MCTVAAFVALGGSRARADEMDKRTVLTVNQPMQVTDRVLQPGTYVFAILGGHSDRYTDRYTVRIYNGDQSHVIDTIVTIPTYRVETTGKSHFTFWETPPGTARALRDWYYPGDSFGREFPYPKHPYVLTASLNRPAPAPAPAPATSLSGPWPGGAFGNCVVERESGGNPQVMNSTGHYGLYQFSFSTWVAYGGAPGDFGHASVAEQEQVFMNAMATPGGANNWAPYDGC